MFDYFSDQGIYTVTPANAIFVEANDGSGWVVVDSLTDNTIPGWNSYSYDLTGYDVSGVVSLRFRAESGGASNDFYNDILVDDVKVRETPSCIQPTFLGSSNLTAASADLDWTAGGTETAWNIQYDTTGFVPGTGTVMNVTTNPYTLTGLTAATSYDYWVQAVCGSDSSAYAGPFTFGTSCNASLAPTNENFDLGFSVCWSQEANDDFDWTVDANGTGSSGTGPSDDFTGGGNYMYTEASLPRAYGDVATMYSEVIDISGLTNPELRFLNHMYGDAIGTLSVDLWDASTGTNLSTVFTHSGDRGDQWNEELIMLSTTATTIQFSITAILDLSLIHI